jgi:hypothetical protein
MEGMLLELIIIVCIPAAIAALASLMVVAMALSTGGVSREPGVLTVRATQPREDD